MAKNFEKLIFGGLHEKHAVQRRIWVPCNLLITFQHGPPRKHICKQSCCCLRACCNDYITMDVVYRAIA
jgi:hypothetical protein